MHPLGVGHSCSVAFLQASDYIIEVMRATAVALKLPQSKACIVLVLVHPCSLVIAIVDAGAAGANAVAAVASRKPLVLSTAHMASK